VICPDCESEALRIFSPVGIVFKGSGFYSTDYNSKSSKAAVPTSTEKIKDKEEKKEEKKPEKNNSGTDTKSNVEKVG
jgi:hypothetical protein